MATTLTRADGASLTFDMVGNVQVLRSGQATRRPVESGQDATDSFRKDPDVIVFDGSVTQTPFEGAAGSIGPQRVADAMEFLEGTDGQLLSLTSDREDLPDADDLILVRAPNQFELVRAVTFAIELMKVRIASVGTATLATTRANRAAQSKRQDAGAQSTETEATTEQRTTLLRKLAGPLLGG